MDLHEDRDLRKVLRRLYLTPKLISKISWDDVYVRARFIHLDQDMMDRLKRYYDLVKARDDSYYY